MRWPVEWNFLSIYGFTYWSVSASLSFECRHYHISLFVFTITTNKVDSMCVCVFYSYCSSAQEKTCERKKKRNKNIDKWESTKDKLRNLDTLYIMSRQILRLNTHIAARYIMLSVLQFCFTFLSRRLFQRRADPGSHSFCRLNARYHHSNRFVGT